MLHREMGSEFPRTGEMADVAQADLQDRPRARLTTVAVKSIETRRLEV